MLRTSQFKFSCLVIATLAIATSAVAESPCKDFRAMYRMNLMINLTTGEGYGWTIDSGGVVGILDDKAFKPTVSLLSTGTSRWTGPAGGTNGVGHDKGQTWVWDFGGGNTFTIGDWHAVYPNQPGNTWGDWINSGTGQYAYNGTGKLVAGAGQFAGATGSFTETGPYLVWLAPIGDTMYVIGSYQGLLAARVCSK